MITVHVLENIWRCNLINLVLLLVVVSLIVCKYQTTIVLQSVDTTRLCWFVCVVNMQIRFIGEVSCCV